jgi:hypothetical protein
MRPLLACVLFLAATAIVSSSPALAGQVPIPDEYIGIWDNTTVIRDCTTQQVLFQTSGRDTVCAGETFDPSFGQYQLDCTGTITATTIDVDCTGTFVIDPECSANLHYVIDGTRNGDNWTTTITIDTDYVGTSCPIAHSCTETTQTGTRIDPNPNCSAQPVEPGTWGQIKHNYRD